MPEEKPWFIFLLDFIASMNVKECQGVVGNVICEEFRNYKKGIHFGGNIGENQIFSFDYIPYREQSKSYNAGIGLIANAERVGEVEKIVVPLVKRRK